MVLTLFFRLASRKAKTKTNVSLCLTGCILLILAISMSTIERFMVKNPKKLNQDSDFSRKCVVFGVGSEYGDDPDQTQSAAIDNMRMCDRGLAFVNAGNFFFKVHVVSHFFLSL